MDSINDKIKILEEKMGENIKTNKETLASLLNTGKTINATEFKDFYVSHGTKPKE